MPSVLDLEVARLRRMTATEKVAVMHSLWRQAWSLKEAGVRGHHPDWSEEEVKAAVREFFRHASGDSPLPPRGRGAGGEGIRTYGMA